MLVAFATSGAADSPRLSAGMGLYRAGNCAAALEEFQASEKAAEPGAERPFYQGVCLARRSDWQSAAVYLIRYTTARPADPRGWYWLAQSRLYSRDFERAKADIEQAIKLDAVSADSYRTLGEIHLERKDYDAAYRAWIRPTNSRRKIRARLTISAVCFLRRIFWMKQRHGSGRH